MPDGQELSVKPSLSSSHRHQTLVAADRSPQLTRICLSAIERLQFLCRCTHMNMLSTYSQLIASAINECMHTHTDGQIGRKQDGCGGPQHGWQKHNSSSSLYVFTVITGMSNFFACWLFSQRSINNMKALNNHQQVIRVTTQIITF